MHGETVKGVLGVYSKVVERSDIFTCGIQKYVTGCEFEVRFRFLVEKS